MAVVAVYALNVEFASIRKEIKNGMVSPAAYLVAKTVRCSECVGRVLLCDVTHGLVVACPLTQTARVLAVAPTPRTSPHSTITPLYRTLQLLEIPLMFVFAVVAMTIPAYVIANFNWAKYVQVIVAWALGIYSWEALAGLLAVQFRNPIMGMMQVCGVPLWRGGMRWVVVCHA